MDPDDATLLAHECESAGYVHYDLSGPASEHLYGHAIPHSVTMAAGGWLNPMVGGSEK